MSESSSATSPWPRIVERLREKWPNRYPTDSSVTQTKVAQLAGISQPSVNKWVHGGLAERKHIHKLAQRLDVSVEWLETGRGRKFVEAPEDPVVAEIFRIATQLDAPQQMELLRYARYIGGDDEISERSA